MVSTIHWFQNPEDLTALTEQFVGEVLPRVEGARIQKIVAAKEEFSFDERYLWVVKAGSVAVTFDGKELFSLEAPAVLGPWFNPSPELSLVGEGDGCQLEAVENVEVSRLFMQDPTMLYRWSALATAAGARYFSWYAHVKSKMVAPTPQYRSFKTGETILKEGEFSHEVMCLVDGDADVIAHGTKVGKIKPEEIFGALAALTGAPRMASVVAAKPTVCMVFERDDFEDLLRSHSSVMSKLVEDMARAMHEANATIAELGVKKSKSWLNFRDFR